MSDLEEALARDAVLARAAGPAAVCEPVVEHRQQQVLDRDVLVLQPLGLLLGARRAAALSARETYTSPGAAPGPLTRGRPSRCCSTAARSAPASTSARVEQARDQAVGLVEQREQQVLDVDLGVAVAQRLGLRVVQRLLRLLGQPVRVHASPRAVVGS